MTPTVQFDIQWVEASWLSIVLATMFWGLLLWVIFRKPRKGPPLPPA